MGFVFRVGCQGEKLIYGEYCVRLMVEKAFIKSICIVLSEVRIIDKTVCTINLLLGRALNKNTKSPISTIALNF